MKKSFITLTCVFTLILASCNKSASGSKSPADQLISAYNQIATQIEDAESAEEVIEILEEAEGLLPKLEMKFDNYEHSEKVERAVKKAFSKLESAINYAEDVFEEDFW